LVAKEIQTPRKRQKYFNKQNVTECNFEITHLSVVFIDLNINV